MGFTFIRDLRDLNVIVIHPDDVDGQFLTDHLQRIGCRATRSWPVPAAPPGDADVIFLAIEHEQRQEIERFVKQFGKPGPTLIAVINYENPSALQLVLESGALAVVERPVKPFGLLTNLVIARNIWLERQTLQKEFRKYRRRALGDQRLARAKAILMSRTGQSETEAYQELRNKAMAQRIAIEQVAQMVIDSDDALRSPNDVSQPDS